MAYCTQNAADQAACCDPKAACSITACDTAVPNAEELKQDILDAFVELKTLLLPKNVTAIRKENVATQHAMPHVATTERPQAAKFNLNEEPTHKVA